MQITIKDLKAQGHEALQNNYWKTFFLSSLMLTLSFSTVFTAITDFIDEAPTAIRDTYDNLTTLGTEVDLQVIAVMIVLMFGVLLLTMVIKITVNIFVKNPVAVGVCLFMKKSQNPENHGMISDMAYGFDHEYTNNVKCMLLQQIAVFLWSLLLIVPGIIKLYEYRLVPYLLSEHSRMTPVEAMKQSSQMMNGHKLTALKLDLSFILWHLAGILTFGILELFFVVPFKYQTDAAFYERVKAS